MTKQESTTPTRYGMKNMQNKKGDSKMRKDTVWCFIDENGHEQCYTFKSDAEDLAKGAEVYSKEWDNSHNDWDDLHDLIQKMPNEEIEAVARQFLSKADRAKRYGVKWDKANTVQIKMKLNKVNDADILEKLESVGNKQGYIKELIRRDLEK